MMIASRALPFAVVLTLAACATGPVKPKTEISSAVAPMPEVVRKLVFKGRYPLRVELVELRGDKALIRLSGSRSEIDGKVLEHTIKSSEDRMSKLTYRSKLRGETISPLLYNVVRKEQLWRYFIPERRGTGLTLSLDKAQSEALDAQDLVRTHRRQKAAGELALQRFDRQWEQRKQQMVLDKKLSLFAERCGHRPRIVVDWKSMDDRALLEHSPAQRCAHLISDLERCGPRYPRVTAFWRSISTIRCAHGAAIEIARSGNRLELTLPAERIPDSQAKALLERLPATKSMTVAEARDLDETRGCVQGDKLIVLRQKTLPREGISYGKKARFYYLGFSGNSLSWLFFDPRYKDPKRRDKWRYHSGVKAGWGAKTCTLACGARKKTLRQATLAELDAAFIGAKFVASPHQRRAHALARDRRGIYYYVDRGASRARSKDFRVFIGRRGSMQKQQMVDVVSDSQGEIFETKRGKLRLIVGRRQALWITKRRTRKLTQVPVGKNLKMIYTELGIYLGKRLGTPCDDF